MIQELERKREQYCYLSSILGDNNTEAYISDLNEDYNKAIRCQNLFKSSLNIEAGLITKLKNGEKITLGGLNWKKAKLNY